MTADIQTLGIYSLTADALTADALTADALTADIPSDMNDIGVYSFGFSGTVNNKVWNKKGKPLWNKKGRAAE